MTLDKARKVKMELITHSGKAVVLKPEVALQDGEVIDSMFMSKKALIEFYEKELEDCREGKILFSLRQSHDDEGITSYRIWSLRESVLQRCLRKMEQNL